MLTSIWCQCSWAEFLKHL